MITGTFAADIRRWAQQVDQSMRLAWQASVFDVVDEINRPVRQGGRMPVASGLLRSSVSSSSVGAPAIITAVRSDQAWRQALTNAVAGAMRTGQLTVAWTAPHARRMEYGFFGADSLGRVYKQQGHAFFRLGIAEWDRIVRSNLQTIRRL